jgi:multiple sugar transport system ATP-binding protein
VELREALGSDVVVHFPIDAAPPVTEHAIELAADVDEGAIERVQETAQAGRSNVIARLNPRTRANQGEPIELVVDTHRLHFFDPDTGLGIYGKDE